MKQPEERILGLFEQCELSAIVTDDQGAKLLNERLLAARPPLVIHTGQMRLDAQANVNFSLKLLELSDLPPVRPEEPARLEATDTAYIIFTSGTTGVPKGVMISAGCARNYTTMIAEHLGLRADDRALETCELSFDFLGIQHVLDLASRCSIAHSASHHGDERRQVRPQLGADGMEFCTHWPACCVMLKP